MKKENTLHYFNQLVSKRSQAQVIVTVLITVCYTDITGFWVFLA